MKEKKRRLWHRWKENASRKKRKRKFEKMRESRSETVEMV